MGKYFTLKELIQSETAKKNHLDNCPDDTQRSNLEHLIEVLDTIREQWGDGIKITSGFRCTTLNKLVGGVPTSAHRIGYAADLFPINGKYQEFVKFMAEWGESNDYDQIIEEHSGNSRWVHFGLYNSAGEQRHQNLKITK